MILMNGKDAGQRTGKGSVCMQFCPEGFRAPCRPVSTSSRLSALSPSILSECARGSPMFTVCARACACVCKEGLEEPKITLWFSQQLA